MYSIIIIPVVLFSSILAIAGQDTVDVVDGSVLVCSTQDNYSYDADTFESGVLTLKSSLGRAPTQYEVSSSIYTRDATVDTLCYVEPEPPVFGTPSWLSATPDNTWTLVGNTFMDVDPLIQFPNWTFMGFGDYHKGIINAWNGAVARDDYLVIPFSGGHRASSQNTVFEFGPFNSEDPSWHWYGTNQGAYSFPSHSLDWPNEESVPYYSDGKPSSRHTYDHIVYLPLQNKVFAPFGMALYGANGGAKTPVAASFSFNIGVGGTYDPQGVYTDFPSPGYGAGGGVGYDALTNLVWIATTTGPDKLHSFDPSSNQYVLHRPEFPSAPDLGGDTDGVALDPVRKLLVVHAANKGLIIWDISQGRAGEYVVIPNYSGPLFAAKDIGFEYEPVGKKFVGYSGGSSIYTMEPPADYRDTDGSLNAAAVWTWVEVPPGIGGIVPTPANNRGTYGRFRYIESIKAFAVINQPGDTGVFVYRVPASGL